MATYSGETVKVVYLTKEGHPVADQTASAKETAGPDVEFLIANDGEDLLQRYGDKVSQAQAMVLAPQSNSATLAKLLEPGQKLENIKWIHSYSAGVDHMAKLLQGPLTSSRDDIKVSNGRGAFSYPLAEYALMACLHYNKRVTRCQENKKNKNYERFIMPVVRDKLIGFVGYGDIAKHTARTAKHGFNMRIAALRRNPDKKDSDLDEKIYTDKLELAKDCDFIVCSLPGTPHTTNFCDEEFFRAMRPGAVFVSVGRGVAVDEAALAKVLREEHIYAALDVFVTEPLPETSELWDVPDDRLLLTAHNADLTADYHELGWKTFRKNFDRFFKGEDLETPVDKSVGY